MAYKWKPSASQKREFAEKMQNEEFANKYYERQQKNDIKRQASSRYSYATAGGYYVPTEEQVKSAHTFLMNFELTSEESTACTVVVSGNKTHHDYIHIVNELRRKNGI